MSDNNPTPTTPPAPPAAHTAALESMQSFVQQEWHTIAQRQARALEQAQAVLARDGRPADLAGVRALAAIVYRADEEARESAAGRTERKKWEAASEGWEAPHAERRRRMREGARLRDERAERVERERRGDTTGAGTGR
ncbi:hypothetical protein EDC01DRAFT_779988 [Geopyxis carbonaria]|nr:hypothetical protein EDC01DRAFT_779988 [Geopyxis carbonaria]